MTPRKTKPVTVYTIAEALGLSASTVCYVLNGSYKKYKISERTAERVRQKANELNYVPNELARSLRRRSSGLIGVVLIDHSNNWSQLCLDGMEQVVEEKPYTIITTIHRWNPELNTKEIQSLLQRRVEGIICVPIPECIDIYRTVQARNVPMVFLGQRLEEMPEISSVMWDSGPAARLAVEHLIKSGRERIGFLSSRMQNDMTSPRYKEYRATLEKFGLPRHEQWELILPPPSPQRQAFLVERIGQLMQDNPRPDAFYVANDGLALVLQTMLLEMGYDVPGDVAIIGMGDLPICRHPAVSLSTMREPISRMGERAIELLLESIDSPQKEPVHEKLLGNELMARRSTGHVQPPSSTYEAEAHLYR